MNKTFTTEKGIAYYPYISAPDTKFDEQGHYKVNLCLSQEKAKPVIEMINNEILSGIKALKADKPNTNIKQANPQEGLHPKTPINVTKIIGNRASPKVKPRLVKATVLPLFFENHLPHNTIDK